MVSLNDTIMSKKKRPSRHAHLRPRKPLAILRVKLSKSEQIGHINYLYFVVNQLGTSIQINELMLFLLVFLMQFFNLFGWVLFVCLLVCFTLT